jgi:glycosyltransferase involved in cell wall biosynthesis
MTKLIIQIPAFNEEGTLAIALNQLPKTIIGIDCIETLIINDGSSDNTVAEAKKHGVDHIVSFTRNKGLAQAFMAGIEECLRQGADIIVNTDADNQYVAADIHKLIRPILDGKADIVIGERPITSTQHFSPVKKFLQKLGSFVMRQVSDTNIPDAPSGFRAISRNAAMRLNVFNPYTYTLEMIIQAGKNKMAIQSVPVRTNEDLRPSRLVKSIPSYIKNSVFTMVRTFNTYKPLKLFLIVGSIPFFLGVALGIRWIILFMGKGSALHLPSLILTAVLIILGAQLWIFGFIADLISVNRQLLQDIQEKSRRNLFDN